MISNSRRLDSTHRLPVTALLFRTPDIILSGEGGRLCVNRSVSDVSNVQSREICFQIFLDHAIHGILEISKDTLLVYGGRQLRLCRLQHDDQQGWSIHLGSIFALDDWILDTALRQTSAGHEVALVTAHNALWTFTADLNDDLLKHSLDCRVAGTNTILYSAHVTWLDHHQLLVAAGTAFGDVILWSFTSPSTEQGAPTHVVHYTFAAHEGSLFGIRISDPSLHTLSSGQSRILATSSDDRTLRLWDISKLYEVRDEPGQHGRGTGFGRTDHEKDFRPPLLAKAMGHASRIWTVRFLQDTSHGLTLKSFGEDTTMITWSFVEGKTQKETPYMMNQVDALQLHTGKNIWSVAVSNTGHIASGGADGAIAIVRPPQPATALPVYGTTGLKTKDFLKSYVLLGRNHLFAISQRGIAQMISLGQTDQVIYSAEQPSLANYSIIAAAGDRAFACGSGEGIFIFSATTPNIGHIPCQGGKTAALFACHACQPTRDQVTVLLRTVIGGKAQLIALCEPEQTGQHTILYSQTVDLPIDFVVTSFTCSKVTSEHCTAFLGSRAGELGMIDVDYNNDKELALKSRYPAHTDATTSLNWLQYQADQAYLLTTSRDGTQAIFHVLHNTFRRIHQLRLPFGPNIEGLAVSEGDELITWGFRNKLFVVYSVTRQVEIMAVDCGGVHRTWAFVPYYRGGRFVWTKASCVFTIEQNTLPFTSMNAGSHGREIKSLAATTLSDEGENIVATGAEDTSIRIFQSRGLDLQCVQVLRKHNTGPQQLSFTSSGSHLFSSGGFEEFYIWKIEQDCPLVSLGVYCESEHPQSGKSDLRITGFVVDEESQRNDMLQVYMCYSDSRVALWTYHKGDWQHVAQADYLTACPNAMLSFIHGRVGRRFITTATDGHLAIWKNDARTADSQRLSWTSRHQVHQSAILSAAYFTLPDGSTVLITGGDDNAITITRLSAELSEVSSIRASKAHAAAVTALLAANTSQQGLIVRSTILSVGLDQRLIVWKLSIDISQPGVVGVSLQKRKVVQVDIADSCGIELLSHKAESTVTQVIIAGIGIQIINLDEV